MTHSTTNRLLHHMHNSKHPSKCGCDGLAIIRFWSELGTLAFTVNGPRSFPPFFRKYLVNTTSFLFWLVCGGVSLNRESFDTLKMLTSKYVLISRLQMALTSFRGIVNATIAFPAKSLQPHLTKKFRAEFFEQFVIKNQSFDHGLPNLLQDYLRLRYHTDVYFFESVEGKCHIKEYWWHTFYVAPYGIRRPNQCPGCECMDVLQTRVDTKGIAEFYCDALLAAGSRGCRYRIVPKIPKDHRKGGPGPKTSVGKWGHWVLKEDDKLVGRA